MSDYKTKKKTVLLVVYDVYNKYINEMDDSTI